MKGVLVLIRLHNIPDERVYQLDPKMPLQFGPLGGSLPSTATRVNYKFTWFLFRVPPLPFFPPLVDNDNNNGEQATTLHETGTGELRAFYFVTRFGSRVRVFKTQTPSVVA